MAGLEPHRAGRRKRAMQEQAPKSPLDIEDPERTREELLDEINSLRTENAYLKKVGALVRSKAMSAQSKKRKS